MNHIKVKTEATEPTVTQAADMLELFAEELPEQRDLAQPNTLGCIGTCGTAGSTFSTLSSVSSL